MSEALFYNSNRLSIARAQNNIASSQSAVLRAVDTHNNTIQSIDVDVDYLNDLANEIALLAEIAAPIAHARITDEIDNTRTRKTRVAQNEARILQDLNGALSNVNYYTDELNRLQKADAETPKYTLEDLRRDIGSNPLIRTKSIAIYKNEPHTVCFVVDGVRLRPDQNPYPWLNNGGDVVIAMPPIRMVVDLEHGRLYAKRCTRKHPYARGTYHNGTVAHPHVINRHGQCCLGDYDPSIREAIANKDLPTAVFLAISFLHGAASSDPAGRGWINFIPELTVYANARDCKTVSVALFDEDVRYLGNTPSTYTYIDGVLTRNTYIEDIAECVA
jgi:hypothetical protein